MAHKTGLTTSEGRDRLLVGANGCDNLTATGSHTATVGAWGLFEAVNGDVTFDTGSVHVDSTSDTFAEDEVLSENSKRFMYLTTVVIKTLGAGAFLRASRTDKQAGI